MHERLSVSGLCFPNDDVDATIEQLQAVGAHQMSFQAAKLRSFGWEAGVERLAIDTSFPDSIWSCLYNI